MNNKRSLRAYESVGGDEDYVWLLGREDQTDYPKLTCPYKDGPCTTRCAFFYSTWENNSPVFCGDTQIGILG